MSIIDNQFREKISILRKKLAEDENSILFAQINEPLKSKCSDFEILHEHNEIFKLFNGGRFGCVDLFDCDLVKKYNTEADLKQISDYYNSLAKGLDLYIIGQILYKPIFINKDTKEIHITIDEEDGITQKVVNTKFDLIDFIKTFIFSTKHLEIINGDIEDEWYQFILTL